MTYEQCLSSILANPDDDVPRRELAKVVRSSDPTWGEFTDRQLDFRVRVRETKYHPRQSFVGNVSSREDELLSEHKQRWIDKSGIGLYMGEWLSHRVVEFDRGLVWSCTMNPHLFLEQGEYVVTCIAPLRGITFFLIPKAIPFP
jgi:hypothetical protein